MSAREQPAARSGSITCWLIGGEDVGRLGHEMHTAEHDVVRAGPPRSVAGQLERVTSHVGELDDLVTLVVVAEYEHAAAKRLLSGAGTLGERGIGRRGERARALHAALAVAIGSSAEREQRKRVAGCHRHDFPLSSI